MRSLRLPLLAAVLTGCVSLGPVPDNTRYYTLHPQPAADGQQRPPLAAVGLGPVRLPPYLDRPQIVTRTGPEQLEVASLDRWAAPLDVLFARTLAEDLREAVPAQELLLWPWPAGAILDWTIAVDVVRFERESDGTCVLEARWTASRAQAGGPVERGRSASRTHATDTRMTSSVAALSQAVGELARDVATALARAPSPAAPHAEPRAAPAR